MTGSILAGGMSTRMGFNKAFIKLDGETVIERSVRVLRGIFEEVNIIANDAILYEPLGAAVISDIIKGAGSLGGLYTAIFHSGSEYTFVTACDMPRLDPETLKRTLSALEENGGRGGPDAYVPFIEGRLHPMHAVYSKRCLKPIEAMIMDRNLRITDLFSRIDHRRLDEGFFRGFPIRGSISNVNTREDLLMISRENK